jgi:hypothetical protein
MNPRFQTLLLVYILAAFLLYFMKPRLLFDEEGNMKCFGTRIQHNACIYSYSLIIIVGACIMFYFYHLMELRRHNIL